MNIFGMKAYCEKSITVYQNITGISLVQEKHGFKQFDKVAYRFGRWSKVTMLPDWFEYY